MTPEDTPEKDPQPKDRGISKLMGMSFKKENRKQ